MFHRPSETTHCARLQKKRWKNQEFSFSQILCKKYKMLLNAPYTSTKDYMCLV